MIPITIIDAFTDEPFKGNPAGVCITDTPLSDKLMQNIAAELNISETAFLVPLATGNWSLRWFTPKIEVDLCGHATLASAHLLWEQRGITSDTVLHFRTLSGELRAQKVGNLIELDFPAVVPKPIQFGDDVSKALGAKPLYSGKEGLFILFELDSAETVRKLNPDLKTLVKLGAEDFIVCARSDDPQFDVISRCFAPGAGIDEDPVTGSAHCALAPYWSSKLGKNILQCYQASKRGGIVETELKGNRVLLRGQARTVLRGELEI
ncbi:MAG: PhzF family phenazine biosynthesis protein [bacterium]|nr:PhzF family phenazine biosynthesis protein [bacterium]